MGIMLGRALSLGVLLSTLTILLDVSQGGATNASLKEFINGTGRFSTIADHAHSMELELLIDSEMGRMLAAENRYVTEGTEDSDMPAVDCGRGKPYTSCTPPENKRKAPEPCSTYKRGCPNPS